MPLQPLSGLRVLDLSRLLPGPYCTMLLADMGAEVIKVETPRIGDYARFLPAELGLSGMFPAINRNKKSIGLNYRNPRGKEVFLRLAQTADVILEGFRPGIMKKMGLDYEAVRAVNSKIIYCSLSGYGQAGPYRDRAGHDPNYLALAGLLGLNGAAGGPPVIPGVPIADLSGGMLAAISILGALVGRGVTGEGAYLDVSLIDAPVSWTAPIAGGYYFTTGTPPERGRLALNGEFPCYQIYETADGQYLTLAALEPDFWAAFIKIVERPDLAPKQFDHAAIPEVAAVFKHHARAAWLEKFKDTDGCVEPIYTYEEMLADPHLRQRGLVVTENGQATGLGSPLVSLSAGARASAPGLGEHTLKIMQELNFTPAVIEELHSKGIIKTEASTSEY